ncbi:MAG TPA: hypothetical protein GXZ87_07690 [Bacteroidales bacterium]|nr:hypothetical protein [Bacteroidales bacterium]
MATKIRIGNDFTLSWSIVRNSLAENLEAVSNLSVQLLPYGKPSIPIAPENYRISGNNITIDFTANMFTETGSYGVELYYKIPDETLLDGMRECTVDVEEIIIVGKSAKADKVRNIAVTSEVAIGFKGDKGKPGEDGKPVVMYFEVDDNMHLQMTSTEDSVIDFEIENNRLKLVV